LCEACTTEYIREKQKTYGFHDCYKRSVETCSRDECSYWHLCNRDFM
jgi:hypothetical protein